MTKISSHSWPELHIRLPDWVRTLTAEYRDTPLPEPEARMQLAAKLATENIQHGGGPFGACVFDADHHTLIAPGINLVMQSNNSILHAEIVAIAMAQSVTGSFDPALKGTRLELISSAEPCAMCMGAIPWAGISRLIYGAHSEDVEQIGFDEGDKPDHWIEKLRQRGIEVTGGILRNDIRKIFYTYKKLGLPIYNGRRP